MISWITAEDSSQHIHSWAHHTSSPNGSTHIVLWAGGNKFKLSLVISMCPWRCSWIIKIEFRSEKAKALFTELNYFFFFFNQVQLKKQLSLLGKFFFHIFPNLSGLFPPILLTYNQAQENINSKLSLIA